ncbi:MAG: hypothetical protein ABH858_01015, partial [Candidatus Omnitrophota bacterium]
SKIENGDWDLSTAQIISQGMGVLNSETIDAQVSGSGLLTVTVTVNWKDRGIRDRTISLGSLIIEP